MQDRERTSGIPEPRLVEEHDLPNGLKVQFLDCSRRVAGDRWYVALLTRIPIEVYREDFEGRIDADVLYKEFLDKYGKTIFFEVRKERNFVDERQVEQVFTTLLERQKEHTLKYMGHKDFAKGFKRRQIDEFEKRRTWWR